GLSLFIHKPDWTRLGLVHMGTWTVTTIIYQEKDILENGTRPENGRSLGSQL
ncbi:hypothetical protein STEG23_032965, partial [Scotinomys teguina]